MCHDVSYEAIAIVYNIISFEFKFETIFNALGEINIRESLYLVYEVK